MNEALAAFGTLIVVCAIVLAIATVLLPIFVLVILLRVHDCAKLLRAVAEMMRIERGVVHSTTVKPVVRR